MKESTDKLNIYRIIRLWNNLTVAELAAALDVTPQFINEVERGVKQFSEEKLKLFFEIANVEEKQFQDLLEMQRLYNRRRKKDLPIYQKFLFKSLKFLMKTSA